MYRRPPKSTRLVTRFPSTTLFRSVGIGFSIPAETAVPIIETLKKGRSIKRGYLGVGIGPMSDDLAESLGLPKNRGEFVGQVVPGEAAAKAGIKAGDVVVRVKDRKSTRLNSSH